MTSTSAGKGLPLGPLAPFVVLWSHRRLIGRLTQRELAGRYRGSLLGALWAVLTPLMMLAVYTFVFSTVFQARWSGAIADRPGSFALFLFAGLILFNILAETVNRAPGLMLENVAYIKKVVFPLEIMPAVILGGALVNAGVGLVILGLFYLPILGLPPLAAPLGLLALLPMCLTVLGIAWFLASAGMFLRDLRQFIGVATTMLMFMSPVFYPIGALPAEYRRILDLNPLVPMLEFWRAGLFGDGALDWTAFGLSLLFGWACCWLGYVWFAKTRKGFADVV